ncbi:MAG: type I DNA topoisomerase [Candidatus Liptonbacteria bacterium]|nr:type I DNA topoisomerase [Candidatus Liptonbacteria bacterium]
MKLVIVESPTKAKTISQFLGTDYRVESSYGHVRDLPKSTLGIDVERDFAPAYIIPRKAQKNVTALKKIASGADRIILAADEDREGEAIAWHLAEVLRTATPNSTHRTSNPTKVERIVFHEITKRAIEEALTHPREIDMRLVDSQQARRTLDRLVGYKLSPFLWKKVMRGLSAGRVQSVALRLIADREEEIQGFTPEEYWTITARFSREGSEAAFDASLTHIGGEPLAKLAIKNEAQARRIAADLLNARYAVGTVEKKEVSKHPLPPFITSTLQQEGARRFGFSSKKTMFLAQNLYENGLITYMRTDSVNLSGEALAEAEEWIKRHLPQEYARAAPQRYQSKSRLAQEAHEAIRPAYVARSPDTLSLDAGQKKLYDLIWRRFLASQLPPARFNAVHVEVRAENGKRQTGSYVFTANGTTLTFDGFLKIWPAKFEEKELPPLHTNEKLALKEITPEQHFTEPPPRYNEASLIKTLEKHGIGRPSTYAPIISVIQERNYVEKRQGRFYPTEIGTLVNKILTEHFPEIVDIQFTAKMEEELDQIAEGNMQWETVIREFYEPFVKHLEDKYESVAKHDFGSEETNEKCEKCGKPMVVKYGRFGKFMACSGFPECKNVKSMREPPKQIGMNCPMCK